MLDLNIQAAADGGFLVFTGRSDGPFRGALFAGSLDECLAYVKKRLSEPRPPARTTY